MIQALIDTHGVIWYLYNDPRLSSTVRTFLTATAQQGQEVGLSAISIAEIVYLVEKGRIPQDCLTRLRAALDKATALLAIVPFDRHVAESVPRIDRAQVPDLPDRIIAATAVYLSVPLFSKDAKIRAANLTTIW